MIGDIDVADAPAQQPRAGHVDRRDDFDRPVAAGLPSPHVDQFRRRDSQDPREIRQQENSQDGSGPNDDWFDHWWSYRG